MTFKHRRRKIGQLTTQIQKLFKSFILVASTTTSFRFDNIHSGRWIIIGVSKEGTCYKIIGIPGPVLGTALVVLRSLG